MKIALPISCRALAVLTFLLLCGMTVPCRAANAANDRDERTNSESGQTIVEDARTAAGGALWLAGTNTYTGGSGQASGTLALRTVGTSAGSVTVASSTVLNLGNLGSSTDWGTLDLSNGSFYMISVEFGSSQSVASSTIVVGDVTSTTASLSGSVSDLKFKKNHDGDVARVKANVWLFNTFATALHEITATVYISEDAKLDSGDAKVVTLKLADYARKDKISKHSMAKLRLNRKLPTALVSFLEGKYLIIDLNAGDLAPSATRRPIVVGPISLPK